MTLEIDGVDIVAAAEIGAFVGGMVLMLVLGLLLYLLVRPPRHVREARRRAASLDEFESAQCLRLMDRMETRLERLEQTLAAGRSAASRDEEDGILEPAEEGRENRRTK